MYTTNLLSIIEDKVGYKMFTNVVRENHTARGLLSMEFGESNYQILEFVHENYGLMKRDLDGTDWEDKVDLLNSMKFPSYAVDTIINYAIGRLGLNHEFELKASWLWSKEYAERWTARNQDIYSSAWEVTADNAIIICDSEDFGALVLQGVPLQR